MIIYSIQNAKGNKISFGDGSPFRIILIDGVSSNSISITESNSTTFTGTKVSGIKVNSKDITVEGDMKESQANRDFFIETIPPGEMCRLFREDTEKKQTLYLDGYATTTPIIQEGAKVYQSWQFVFHVPFPYWKNSEKSSIDFTTLVKCHRFPRSYSKTKKWKLGYHEYKPLLTITNKGDKPTGFILKFEAEADTKNPSLVNVKTEERISFTAEGGLEMQAGDILEVSTYENSCYCHLIRGENVENVFYKLSYDSTFFQLDLGENILRYGATLNEKSLFANVTFEEITVGV